MCAVNPAGYLATVARLLGEAESRNPGGATKRDAKQIYVEGYQRPFLLICMLPSPRLAAPPSRDHAGRRRDASMESRFRNLLLLTKNDERTLVARHQLAGVLFCQGCDVGISSHHDRPLLQTNKQANKLSASYYVHWPFLTKRGKQQVTDQLVIGIGSILQLQHTTSQFVPGSLLVVHDRTRTPLDLTHGSYACLVFITSRGKC